MSLRPYQQKNTNEILSALKNHDGVLYQAGTGSGKTVTFCNIASMARGTVWVLVNREELLKSTYKTLLKNHGIKAEILHPKIKNFDPKAKYVVAMVQTLRNRKEIDLSHVTLLVIDEAHLTDYDTQITRFHNAKRFAVTATPKRKGRHKQLVDFYTKMVCAPSIADLIKMNYLVPCESYTFNSIDLGKVPEFKGEYEVGALYAEFDKPIIYVGVVQNWKRLAKNKQTLIFCVNIDHAKKMTAEFLANGVVAKYVVSDKMDEKRKDILAEWNSREFDVLINASIFTTGFDCPQLECVVTARATMSENLWLQMLGRGSRTFEGKEKFILLDFGENIDRHGIFEQERKYSLIHKTRLTKGAPVMKECPSCQSYLLGSAKTCLYCGFVFPLSKQELVEVELAPYVAISWGSIDAKNPQQLDKIMRAKKKTPAWVARQIFVKEPNDYEVLIHDFARFKNYSSGWAYRAIENLKLKKVG